MSSKYCVEDEKTRRNQEASKAHYRMLDEKLIETVQMCPRCGRKFPLKQGRKHCPHCQGLLKVKNVIILKVP